MASHQNPPLDGTQRHKRFSWILGVIVSAGFLAILVFVIVTLLILQSQGISRGINILTIISIVGSFVIGVFGLLLSFCNGTDLIILSHLICLNQFLTFSPKNLLLAVLTPFHLQIP